MINLKTQKPARRYAGALFEAVCDKNPERVLAELGQFTDAQNNAEFKNFLLHPIIAKDDKKEVITKVFGGFTEDTLNFLKILVDENRLDCLSEIKAFFANILNGKNNVMPVVVTLAIDPAPDMKSFIQKRLETKFGAVIDIKFIKNEDILGGMLIKIGDTIADLSIKRKIENFKRI